VTLVDDPIAKQQDLQAAKQAIAGPVPLMPQAPDTAVSLALGLYHNGEYYTDVEVRELTGADEEVLAKVKDEVASFSTVIALGTVRVGPMEMEGKTLQERKSLLGGLLIGDRDKLFLSVVRVTFGDKKQVAFTCMHCGEGQEVDLLLSEDFPQTDGDVSSRLFSYVTNKGDSVEYRLATGEDQEQVLDKPISLAEQNTLMLARCITKVNGELAVDPLGFARSLGMKDRSALLNELASKQPSVSLEVTTTCAACGEEVPLSVSWGIIFRP
jgi:hypothetical protein